MVKQIIKLVMYSHVKKLMFHELHGGTMMGGIAVLANTSPFSSTTANQFTSNVFRSPGSLTSRFSDENRRIGSDLIRKYCRCFFNTF